MKRAGNRPFVWITLAFATGIACAEIAGAYSLILCLAFLPATIILALKRYKKDAVAASLALLAFAASGALWHLPSGRIAPDDISLQAGNRTEVRAVALDIPVSTRKSLRLPAEVTAAGQSGASGRIMLYLPKGSADILPGDSLRFTAEIRPVDSPYEGYNNWLHRQDIHSTAYARNFEVTQGGPGLGRTLSALRQDLAAGAYAAMPDSQTAGLAVAMLLGDRSGLDPDMRADFAASGLSHLLAISGLHVGLIYLLLLSLMRMIPLPERFERFSGVPVLLILVLYAMMTGAAPAVVRAVSLIGLYEIAKMFRLRADSLNLLAFTAFIQLLADPGTLWNPGFQLSYAAVGGILLWCRPLSLALRRRWSGLGAEPASLIAMTLTAQALTAPLIFLHFGELPTWFLPANLLIMPVAVWAVRIGFAALMLSFIPFAGAILWKVADVLLWFCAEISSWIADLPAAQVRALSPADPGFCVWLVLASLGLLWYAVPAIRMRNAVRKSVTDKEKWKR